MTKGHVNSLLADTINSKHFTNLDQDDINKFKEGVDSIDAIKIYGKSNQIGYMLSESFTALEKANKGKFVKKLFFAIRLPIDNNFKSSSLSKVHDYLDMLSNNIQCIWGLSTCEELEGNNIELVVSVGLNNYK